MLDPLRSLAELVRTLTRSRADRRAQTSATSQHSPAADTKPAASTLGGVEELRERLRRRLTSIDKNDRRRAREAFVETVLASELGDAVTLDPALSDVVRKVAQQLGNDPATERDLALLFDELAS